MHSPSLGNGPLLPYVTPRPTNTRSFTGAGSFLNAAISVLDSPIEALRTLDWKSSETFLQKELPTPSFNVLSPLVFMVQDTKVPIQKEDPWTNSPLIQSHSMSSPRQRFGLTRGTFPIPETTSCPAIPQTGYASPTIPMLSKINYRRILRRFNSPSHHNVDAINPQMFWVTLYFAFNLVLTLYNKGMLMRFPFPYSLTALHALFGCIGGMVLRRHEVYVPAPLSSQDHAAIALFSVLYAVNIAVSNVSLHLVTVPVSKFDCSLET